MLLNIVAESYPKHAASQFEENKCAAKTPRRQEIKAFSSWRLGGAFIVYSKLV
jgi:hypothetical protein